MDRTLFFVRLTQVDACMYQQGNGRVGSDLAGKASKLGDQQRAKTCGGADGTAEWVARKSPHAAEDSGLLCCEGTEFSRGGEGERRCIG